MILTWLSAVVGVFCSVVSIQLVLSGDLWPAAMTFLLALVNFALSYWHCCNNR